MKVAEIQLLGELYVSLLERLYKVHDVILDIDVQPNESITITETRCAYFDGIEINKQIHLDGIRIFKKYDTLFKTEQKYMYIEYNIDDNNKLSMYCEGGYIKFAVVELIVTKPRGSVTENIRTRPSQNDTKICRIIYEIFGKIQTLLKEYEHRGTTING